MRTVSILDCTLRDGGYVNDWKFGGNNIARIIRKNIQANIDIVECGYLSVKRAGDSDVAIYQNIEDVRQYYAPQKKEAQSYAVMINFGEYPIERLPAASKEDPIIRIAFHKKDRDAALDYAGQIKQKGYRIFLQPMGALNYTDAEYVTLIGLANTLGAEAFYIVDSYGVMELNDFSRLLLICHNNLDRNVALGYHSHNNLQQAYENAKYVVSLALDRNVIIDATVFGIGRGAGNLNIELFARYLNSKVNCKYDIEPLLEVFDECLKPLFAKNPWGYSLPFFLSSIHNCHPNYANYFSERNTLSVKSMHEILSMISDDDKSRFSEEKASKYYIEYQSNFVNDEKNLQDIERIIDNRAILILAPGKTLTTHASTIDRYIDENNPAVIGVGRASEHYAYDLLFVSNEKRLSDSKPDNVDRRIVTSNLHSKKPEDIQINYSSYLCAEDSISDNPTLMLINMLIYIGTQEIAIAGFDGFSTNPDDNYFSRNDSLGSSLKSKLLRNELIATQVKSLHEKTHLNFITPSRYLKQGDRRDV